MNDHEKMKDELNSEKAMAISIPTILMYTVYVYNEKIGFLWLKFKSTLEFFTVEMVSLNPLSLS